MESKIIIFESGKDIGIMSAAPKFYEENIPEEERKELFHQNRIKLGNKYNFDGNKIFHANQKSVTNKLNYPDGHYILLNDKFMDKEDYYIENLEADILILPSKYKGVGIGNPQADCPILIVEDRNKGYTALSHCGAPYIDRLLPIDTIKALEKEVNSNLDDLYIYIGNSIKKESYVYDKYPSWATNESVWKDYITKEDDGYHIDLTGAILKQLQDYGIKNIEKNDIDVAKDDRYYSHSEYSKGNLSKKGQNFVGFFYK